MARSLSMRHFVVAFEGSEHMPKTQYVSFRRSKRARDISTQRRGDWGGGAVIEAAYANRSSVLDISHDINFNQSAKVGRASVHFRD